MQTTVDKVIEELRWKEEGITEGRITVPVLSENILLEIFTRKEKEDFFSEVRKNIEGILSFGELELGKIKQLLYESCVFSCEVTDFGFPEIPNMSPRDSNLKGFGIENKEDAFRLSRIDRIQIDLDDEEELKNRYYSIIYAVPWEGEHDCYIIVKNDEVIAYYDGYPAYSWYEEGGKFFNPK